MTSTTATAAAAPRSRVAIAAPDDRTAAFRRARRHTFLVKTLRASLPIASLLMMSSYWVAATRSFSLNIGPVSIPSVSLSTENLTMERPNYEGFGKDGSRYSVKAASAVQDLRQQGPIKLNGIDGKLIQPNQQGTVVVTAPRGTFDSKANVVVLMDKVDIDGDNGLKARMTEATLLLKEHKVISKQPVMVEMTSGQVRGNEMVFLQAKREITFSNGVTTILKPQGQAFAAKPGDSKSALTLGAGNAPVEVQSRTLHVNDVAKTALFSGSVTARQGEASLSAATLEAHYDGQPVPLAGKAAPQPAPSADATGSGKLKRLIAKDDLVMSQGGDRVTSGAGDFDPVNETAVLTGGIVMTSAPDRRAVSDRAELNQRADTALLTGNVEVTQGGNIMRGRRLYLDRKAGKLQLSSPAEAGQPTGRIYTRLVQQPADDAKRRVPARTKPAAEAGAFAVRGDPGAPVEIEADTLDANDAAKTAIYRGNVRAVQGESVIQTAELIAHYTGSATAGVGIGKTDVAGQAPKSATELTKVQAKSRVTVTSGPDQSATGDQADFDVKNNRVTVVGNVTLRQGKNVTHGPKATIDLTSGHYQMEGNAPGGWRAVSPPANGSILPDLVESAQQPKPSPRVTDPAANCPPGRSCGVFHPSDAKNFENRAKPTAPGPAAAPAAAPAPAAKGAKPATTSSWDATTFTPKAPN